MSLQQVSTFITVYGVDLLELMHHQYVTEGSVCLKIPVGVRDQNIGEKIYSKTEAMGVWASS